jgi:hypothetical protein
MRQTILLLPLLLLSLQPGQACSGQELVQKMNAVTEASMAAYTKNPEASETRQAQAQAIIARYSGIHNGTGGAAAIDAMCNEYDELLAVYK